MSNCAGISFKLTSTSTFLSMASLFSVAGCFFSAPECELCGDPRADVCIPSEGHGPPPDRCGKFVARAAPPGGDGTKARPFRVLAEALAAAGADPDAANVYACGEVFAEAVEVPPGVRLYGALDCMHGFRYAPERGRTEIAPLSASSPVALRLARGDGETRVIDVRVVAPPASEPGGSSIAALVEGVAALFVRTTLVARDGADGADGAPFEDVVPSGAPGAPGLDACVVLFAAGGQPVSTACDDGASRGGKGGDGTATAGGDGEDGGPLGVPNHGIGQPDGDPSTPCTGGWNGASGEDGAPGRGGGHEVLGVIGLSGYAGEPGEDGAPGGRAQGGGGGGGSRGGSGAWACAGASTGGASGGGGGAGGCGGRGGRGGMAGGASIALLSLAPSTLSFERASLIAGHGGDGGVGGPGQLGGEGGHGGDGGWAPPALYSGCPGGAGGRGGVGGRGGGGAGGPSIGIAHTGPLPVLSGADVSVGAPGRGGLGAGDLGSGSDGVSAATLEMAN